MSKTNKLNLAPFDASDYLDSEEVIAEYLTVALEDPERMPAWAGKVYTRHLSLARNHVLTQCGDCLMHWG
jgi:DNA-binding phage protein